MDARRHLAVEGPVPTGGAPAMRAILRAGIAALFIEGSLWLAIRIMTFVYVLAQEVDLGSQHQTSGWVRLRIVGVTVAGAAVLMKAGGAVRNGSGPIGRLAEVCAFVANVALLLLAGAAVARFSGAQAEVVAIGVLALAGASLAAIAGDLWWVFVRRRDRADASPA